MNAKTPSFFRSGWMDRIIERFFGANALVAVLTLALITLFLCCEGGGFFAQYLAELRIYRQSGLEAVDLLQAQTEHQTALARTLLQLRLEYQQAMEKEIPGASGDRLVQFDDFIARFEAAAEPLREITLELRELAGAIKEKAAIQPVDFPSEILPVRQKIPEALATCGRVEKDLFMLWQGSPLAFFPEALLPRVEQFNKELNVFLSGLPEARKALETWDPFKPVPWYDAVTSFFLGSRWITNSFWQDWYGVLPLICGSLLVTFTAMGLAVPLGIIAAVYVSEMASPREYRILKPCIELIAAIPSVVFGFVGIMIVGETLRTLSHWKILAWLPGFPFAERLNALTAGSLLALMALPTIFTLSEDALQRVPKEFNEASFALGSTKIQWILRVLFPAALPGLVSAVLLGFGRVIGETMVVLLCAGNRTVMPNPTISAFFEPVHTMTGIIAQEMGEVVQGSTHYRALFVIGLLLFLISLSINGLAQSAARRFKTPLR